MCKGSSGILLVSKGSLGNVLIILLVSQLEYSWLDSINSCK